MKQKLAALFLCLALAAAAAPPVPVIFDTDMGNDIDDALALAMLHGLESRGEIRLAAVTLTKDNPWAGRYVSAVNTFYGRERIPIGLVKNGVTKDEGNYNRVAIEMCIRDRSTTMPEGNQPVGNAPATLPPRTTAIAFVPPHKT